jgi:beta-glucanase (GH16 family)
VLPQGLLGLRYKGEESSFRSLFVEARMKLPNNPGPGLWPAFWMLPSPANKSACEETPFAGGCDGPYGKWPRSGEIDIMEAVNDMTYSLSGVYLQDVEEKTLHLSGPQDVNAATKEWHIYGVEW